MKKVLFSLLLIGTFAAYALYIQQGAQNGTGSPVVLDTRQSPSPVADTVPVSAPPVVSQTPPPPGNDQLNLQAQGKVRITNTDSVPLTLVKTTRLLTSDGKLYRLAQTVIVPAQGQIIADAYADQNGSLYAIGPSTFSVPGLPASLQSYVAVSSESAFVMAQPLSLASNAAPSPSPAPAPARAPAPTPAPAPAPQPAPKPKAAYRDGTYTGDSVDAYYGNVQVAAVIQGGRISDVRFLDHPQDRSRSVAINNYAMPNLTSEAIQAQSANVDVVSGATATSDAFVQSLASALVQAKN